MSIFVSSRHYELALSDRNLHCQSSKSMLVIRLFRFPLVYQQPPRMLDKELIDTCTLPQVQLSAYP